MLGNAKGVNGPYTKGTYVWVEVNNLKRLEAKIVEGKDAVIIGCGEMVPYVLEAQKILIKNMKHGKKLYQLY